MRKTKKAMTINGQYLEDLIPGYYTLNVTGRERLGVEVNTTQRGMDDGAVYNYRRYQTRTLTISFIIEASEFYDSAGPINALNKLNSILDVEEAKFIFDDEPDKFYIGTPGESSDIGISLGTASGTFEIFCSTPYKYSTLLHEATPGTDGSIVITYKGTAKSYPTLEAQFYEIDTVDEDGNEHTVEEMSKGDCGYISFFTEDKAIIQLGDPDEADTESDAYSQSQSLLTQSFDGTGYSSALDNWTKTGTLAIERSCESGTGADTSNENFWNGASYAETPIVHYKMKVYSTNRTETTVNITVNLDTWLDKAGSYIENGPYIIGNIYVAGVKHETTIKYIHEYWSGTGVHSSGITCTVGGLSSTSTSIGDIYFEAAAANGSSSGRFDYTNCGSFGISAYGTGESETYYVHPTAYASNKATMLYSLPGDCKEQETPSVTPAGSTNFKLSWKQKFCITSGTQYGGITVQALDSSNQVVVAAEVSKTSSGSRADINLYADVSNGTPKLIKTMRVDCSYTNSYFGASSSAVKTCYIEKQGTAIKFYMGGKSYSYTATINRKVTQVKVIFTKNNSSTMAYNGIHEITFMKYDCETTRNVDNKFSANDLVSADCSSGYIYLNSVNTPSLGALGNDWETFYLSPGTNQIGVAYSSWVEDDYKPSFKVKYREVFL